jgi:SAM-dependent methyltransferase
MDHYINHLLPDTHFANGFTLDGEDLPRPFFSFEDSGPINWSSDMSEFIAETSEHHFIDIYNRAIPQYFLKRHLAGNHKPRIIDIGCSNGHFLSECRNHFPESELIGSDFEKDALVECHNKNPEIPLLHFDLTKCPLPDKSFDAIVALNILEHIKDDALAVSQLKRLLKPGGIIVATVPAAPHLYDLYDEIHYHERRYTKEQFTKLFRDSGFKILKHNYFASFLYPAFYIVKRINQYRYKNLSFQEKHNLAKKQAEATSSNQLMNSVCKLEFNLGLSLPLPFGIRTYVVATLP